MQRFPVGPVLAITPFNFPSESGGAQAAPAMAAGCPFILKPAPQTPFTALALGEVILKAGWPEEALAVLPLSNADTAWLAEKEDRIKLVSFTGSAKVGWELKAHSGRKRVLLELGGNAALIVHGDWPDLDDAASGRRMRRLDTPGSPASACSAFLSQAPSSRRSSGSWSRLRQDWFPAIRWTKRQMSVRWFGRAKPSASRAG